MNRILRMTLAACAAHALTAFSAEPAPSDPWTDDRGRFISAHDGGISRFGGTYYWYGSCYRGNPSGRYGPKWHELANGFNVYSSKDLMRWKSEGVCLTVPTVGFGSQGTLHRPNVLFNGKTRKYVMWCFVFSKYPDVMLAVATADSPAGPFQIVGRRESGEDHGWAQDLGTFKDDDGKAYIVYDDCHQNLRVDLLTDDYLASTKKSVIALKAPAHEGAAMIKYQGKYIVAGSGLVGWGPSETHYAVADSPLGPYSEKRQMSQQRTWGSQISNFFYSPDEQTVYALCDRWWHDVHGRATHDLEQSSYYFLPVRFDSQSNTATLDFEHRLVVGTKPQ